MNQQTKLNTRRRCSKATPELASHHCTFILIDFCDVTDGCSVDLLAMLNLMLLPHACEATSFVDLAIEHTRLDANSASQVVAVLSSELSSTRQLDLQDPAIERLR